MGFKETLEHKLTGSKAKRLLLSRTHAGPATQRNKNKLSSAGYALTLYKEINPRVWVSTPGFAKDRPTLNERDTRNLSKGENSL